MKRYEDPDDVRAARRASSSALVRRPSRDALDDLHRTLYGELPRSATYEDDRTIEDDEPEPSWIEKNVVGLSIGALVLGAALYWLRQRRGPAPAPLVASSPPFPFPAPIAPEPSIPSPEVPTPSPFAKAS